MRPASLKPTLALAFGLALALAAAAQGTKGMVKKDGPADPKTAVAYRKKWAIVVGIDYKAADRAALDRGRIEPLQKAEADAKKFHELLVGCFGYEKGNVVLLTGKAATKEAVERQLQNGFFCDKEKVGPDDSILFYFSGHGYLRRDRSGEKGQGYLLPFDVLKLDNGEPDLATAIDFPTVLVKNLRDHCPARHKLAVLDCCHSGSVFRVEEGFGGGRSESERVDADLFKAGAFQAVTASREGQLASDGNSLAENSPFTSALLRAMAMIAQKQLGDRSHFTASELFREMQVYLHGALPEYQSPQCWWLDGGRGEFHFFPAREATFPKVELNQEQKEVFLALVPSTFGNWWADEFPWFMPSLRYEILAAREKTKSGEPYLDVRELRKVARHLADAMTKTGGEIDYRYRHLDRLLATEGAAGRARAIDEIIEELQARVKKEEAATHALDLHYLGVLLQKRGRFQEAGKAYEDALKAYAKGVKGKETLRPLHALCLLDHGILCLNNLFAFDRAVESFQKARLAVEAVPGPFAAFTFCREADAYRRLGMFGLSDGSMCQARGLMADLDPSQLQPLSAATWKHDAWAFMEQCKFKEAAVAFGRSKHILEKLVKDGVNRHQCLIDLFHIDHGLALIERFQGRDENALTLFRRLTPRIASAVAELDGSTEFVPGYAEVRQLLCERYVNSLERQADCSLFGRVPDPGEAADDYRRALRACGRLPEDRRDVVKIDLLYRRAVALALPSPAQDRKLAEQMCQEAADIEQHLRTTLAVDTLPDRVKLTRAIARTLVLCADGRRDVAAKSEHDLLTVVRSYQEQHRRRGPTTPAGPPAYRGRSFDRDELERLMFGYRLLLQNRDCWGLDRFEVSDCCDHLLSLCRGASRPRRLSGGTDLDFLAYLRGYYDEAFLVKAGETPTPVKELIEIAWEATRGTPYLKPEEIAPALVMYRAAGQVHLLLDVPSCPGAAGASKCFLLKQEWNDEQLLREASESSRPLPLPEEVRRALAAVKHPRPVALRWRDPVSGLGTASPLARRDPGTSFRFPFNLQPALAGDRYSDKEDEKQLAGRSVPAAGTEVTRQPK